MSANNAQPQRGTTKKTASPWRKQAHCATAAAHKSYLRYVRNGKRGVKA